jgi:hypothetical protein
MTSRGIRNNNPLNIRRSADRWEGARARQTDRSFVQFESMAFGYRAAWKILERYWQHFKEQRQPFTVGNIIARWAPPSENDTEAYVRTVLRLTSLGGNEHLPRAFMGYMLDKLASLLAAMTVMESGIAYDEVDQDAIWHGYDLAFPGKRITRAGYVRSTEPLVMQPVPLPEPLEKTFHNWDEYWDWSPKAFND